MRRKQSCNGVLVINVALLIIDVQMGFVHRDATGDARSCPQAEQNISTLLTVFRAEQRPIIHVHHHSLQDGSFFSQGTTGCDAQPFAAPQSLEPVVIKNVNSGFIGTDLEQQLIELGRPKVFICGATANHCVETTTRMAGNLGFDVVYISDAVWAYGEAGPDGQVHSPEQVHSMSLANLDGEFATVLSTAEAQTLLV